MIPYLILLRPANAAMAAVAVLVGGLLVAAPPLPLATAMLAAFLITGAGNAVNDAADAEVDRINKPRRPIPAGRMTPGAALFFAALLFLAGLVLAWTVTWLAFFLAMLNSALLVAYPYALKGRFLTGNVAVSYLVGSTFLFGGTAGTTAGSLLLGLDVSAFVAAAWASLKLPLLLLALAFLANLAREVVKDFEDVRGDRAVSRKSGGRLTAHGIRHPHTLRAAAEFALILAVLVSPAPALLGLVSDAYLVLLVPTDALFLVALFEIATGKKSYRAISRHIKFGMLLGLLAFLAGALA